MSKKTRKEINSLLKEMLGKPMTKEQLSFQEELRAKVKAKEITVIQAHIIWSKKYKLDDLAFWESLGKKE